VSRRSDFILGEWPCAKFRDRPNSEVIKVSSLLLSRDSGRLEEPLSQWHRAHANSVRRGRAS
jgi:hypothetical protein